jgi:hypothetical protein
VDLAHREPPALQPAPVVLTELRVEVAARMLLEIFEMQELYPFDEPRRDVARAPE